jgi:hypothetical protein
VTRPQRWDKTSTLITKGAYFRCDRGCRVAAANVPEEARGRRRLPESETNSRSEHRHGPNCLARSNWGRNRRGLEEDAAATPTGDLQSRRPPAPESHVAAAAMRSSAFRVAKFSCGLTTYSLYGLNLRLRPESPSPGQGKHTGKSNSAHRSYEHILRYYTGILKNSKLKFGMYIFSWKILRRGAARSSLACGARRAIRSKSLFSPLINLLIPYPLTESLSAPPHNLHSSRLSSSRSPRGRVSHHQVGSP